MDDLRDRFVFAAGAAAVVLAALPYRAFDLDLFFAPKELALHACALALALPALRRLEELEATGVDLLLGAYLLLGALSALFAADHWLAARALAISVSGAVVFWRARAAEAGTRRALVVVVAAAAAAAAATSLAQAYGAGSALFSPHRVPGGTLGNRNFVAHLAAVCAPVLLLASLRARRAWPGAAGAAVLAAALVLTRSRAALLGLGAGGAVLAWGFWRARAALLDERALARLKALLAAALLGALAALTLPNRLEWRSESPYLDTLAGLADYREGSGHGRVVQYARSLRIAARHPALGAGPGNWAVAYPRYVRDADRSIDYATGRTINPWPSSDWIAVACERGLPALAALAAAFAALALGGWRRGQAKSGDAAAGLALAATLAAAAVVGGFDAFLLLPAPAFLLWAAAGALAQEGPVVLGVGVPPVAARRLALAAALVLGGAALRSAGQIVAMSLFSTARTRAQVARAALFDPGNVRIRSSLSPRTGR